VLDYLQTDPAVDAAKVAVIGHSRGGKTALWAAAQDARFALAISNCSGRGGASLARRRMGETVKVINRSFPYWFCDNFKKFDDHEDELPVDQHQLIALIAPRAVYVASAEADFWADQRGEFLALANASPVFALYGEQPIKPDEMPPLETPLIRGHRAYHIRHGVHNLTPYDWQRYMDFADTLWPDRPR
jgi:pimeloyl-ACP methyl ester carboxylesterase